MRVAHLTTAHPPDDARIVVREAATLADAGHDVHVVARMPKPYKWNGISFHPLGIDELRPGPHNAARRLRAAYRAARRLRADVYHVHDPELIPVALALRGLRARVVYDVHEDTPREILDYTKGRTGRSLSRAVEVAEATAGRALDGVVAATPTIAARFPAAKTVLVRNFPVAEERERFAGGPPLHERERVAVYVGGVSEPRGAREMVVALGSVEDARLALAGNVQPPTLREALATLPGWERVDELGWLDRAGVAAALHRARLGLVVLHPLPIHLEALPVKLFEYMAAGLPVVASDFPVWRAIVEEAGCGLLVDPLDPDAIAAAMEQLLADPDEAEAMGQRGREAVESRYAWEGEANRLLHLYAGLAR